MKFKRIGRTLGLIGIVGMCLASAGNSVVLAYQSQGVPLYLDATDDVNDDSQKCPEPDPNPKPTPSEEDDEDKDTGEDKGKDEDDDKDEDNDKDKDDDKDPGDNPGGDKNNKPTPTTPEPVIPPPVIINPILPVPPVPIEEESEPLKNDDNKNKRGPTVKTRQTEETEEESIEEMSEIIEEPEPLEETEEDNEPEREEFTESEIESEIIEEEPVKKNIMKTVAAAVTAVAVAVGSGGAIFFFIMYAKRPGLTGFYETEGLSVKYKDIYGKDTDLEYMVSADEIADKCSNTEEFIDGLRDSGIRTILPVFSKATVRVIYEDGGQDTLKVKLSDNSIYDAIEEAVDAGNSVEIRITNLRGNKRLKPVIFNRY